MLSEKKKKMQDCTTRAKKKKNKDCVYRFVGVDRCGNQHAQTSHMQIMIYSHFKHFKCNSFN